MLSLQVPGGTAPREYPNAPPDMQIVDGRVPVAGAHGVAGWVDADALYGPPVIINGRIQPTGDVLVRDNEGRVIGKLGPAGVEPVGNPSTATTVPAG